jgi:hypothetical protein
VVGSCYRDLAGSDPTQALKAEEPIKQAMAQRGEAQVRNQALDRVNLATARLRRDELDGTCDEGNRAVDIASMLRSHRVTKRLNILSRLAEPHEKRHIGIRLLRGRIAALPELA